MGNALLGGVLPFIYGQGNRLRNRLTELATDPVAVAQQTAGGIQDAHREQAGLMAQAFADPTRPFNVTNEVAMMSAANALLNGAMGMAPAGIFAGVAAKTANKATLAKAQALDKAGADPAAVWKDTGWGKGPDGKWRFEIDDSEAENLFTNPKIEWLRMMNGGEWIPAKEFMKKYPNTEEALAMRLRNTMYADRLTNESPTLGQSFSHPRLTGAYPDMSRTRTVIKNDMPIGDAAYTAKHDAVLLSPMAGRQADNVMLHELQHAVQEREGFARGGTPSIFPKVTEQREMLSDANVLSRMVKSQGDIKKAKALFTSTFKREPTLGAESLALSGEPAEKILGRRDGLLDPEQAYMRLAGEAEARLVQQRMEMSPRQRLERFPWDAGYFKEATGVPLDSLIFR